MTECTLKIQNVKQDYKLVLQSVETVKTGKIERIFDRGAYNIAIEDADEEHDVCEDTYWKEFEEQETRNTTEPPLIFNLKAKEDFEITNLKRGQFRAVGIANSGAFAFEVRIDIFHPENTLVLPL